MHHISNPLNLKTCYDPTCHDVMEKKFSAAVPVAYWCYGLGIVKQSWSRTIQCSSNKMRTEPAMILPVLRFEMWNRQYGRCYLNLRMCYAATTSRFQSVLLNSPTSKPWPDISFGRKKKCITKPHDQCKCTLVGQALSFFFLIPQALSSCY